MIVRPAAGTLHLITQPDHAALARRIMERWAPLHGAERRNSILLAVEEHDNGWHEPDSAPSINPATGRIFDFVTAPASVRQGVWPRGVARLAGDDVWAAALVAQHALTVYDRYRGDAEWEPFFERIAVSRDALVMQARRTLPQLTLDYSYVRIGDLISLIFCNEWDEEQTYGTWGFRRAGNRVIVTPDALAGCELPIAVRARTIPDRPYESDADLRDAIRRAPSVTLHGTVSGAL